MKRVTIFLGLLLYLLVPTLSTTAQQQDDTAVYLPLVQRPIPLPMVELRGLWVTRFDWTNGVDPADAAVIDQIVIDAAEAGFNTIYFQVRGTADAFYDSTVEPWAQRVSGETLGQPPDPYWDPLAHFVAQAHAHGLQLHAYINVYPVWSGCTTPPDAAANPTPFYYLLRDAHGTTGNKLNGVQWNDQEEPLCWPYQYASPASFFVDDHLMAVARDLVTRYDVDGLHLDHIRYGNPTASCDPVSTSRYGTDCFADPGYADWQRAQVTGTVRRFYEEIVPLKADLWLSAAVWPIYQEKPEWGWGGWATEGYHDYYQDSKGWLAEGIIDSISPMIYPATFHCPDDSFWSVDRWHTLAADFQGDANGRFVIPGIGAGYCDFAEIETRINLARQIGAAGHALFSYSGLRDNGYFDDLKQGPYAQTAVSPISDATKNDES